jgi:hypothetical protein
MPHYFLQEQNFLCAMLVVPERQSPLVPVDCHIDVLVLQVWHIEMFTLARNNVAFTDCDAKACYNRVIPLVLALAQIQAGLPVKTAQVFSEH